jgi:hypothetical protein
MNKEEKMKSEDSYTQGEKVRYQEDNMVLAVEILANNCNPDTIDYQFKIIRNIVPHYLFGEFRIGGKFRFSRVRDAFGCTDGLGKIISEAEEELTE